jgi:hypothetical protein
MGGKRRRRCGRRGKKRSRKERTIGARGVFVRGLQSRLKVADAFFLGASLAAQRLRVDPYQRPAQNKPQRHHPQAEDGNRHVKSRVDGAPHNGNAVQITHGEQNRREGEERSDDPADQTHAALTFRR